MKNLILFVILLLPIHLNAGSVAGTGGSTEITQIANNLQLANQYRELIEQGQNLANQLRRQAEMVSDMQKQGKSITNFQWGNASTDLQQLARAVNDGQALAYSLSSIDSKYRQTYKGYAAYADSKLQGQDALSSQYANWSQTNNDTIRSSMRAANLQQSQFSSEEQTLKTLERMGSTASGRMQAIQVGNQIAAVQVGQMQKLRGLMMAQMQMQAGFMANETARSDMQTAEGQKFFKKTGQQPEVGNGRNF